MNTIQFGLSAATRCVFVATCFFFVKAYAYDELSFHTIERVRNDVNDRERMVILNFYFSPSNRVDYELRETPYGSLSPMVKFIEFQREIDITSEEARMFAERLVAAGLFSLPKSGEHRIENIWSIFGSLRDHTFELSYRHPPKSGARKRVEGTVQAIAHQLGLDRIEGPTFARIVREGGTQRLQVSSDDPRSKVPAVTETEGDRIAARVVSLSELIAHPNEYHGKRVSVVGFYHSEFEGSELRSNEKSDYAENVWCETISSFALKGTAFEQDCWARIDGSFLKGPAGHFGMWPGEITRVTRFEAQSQPIETSNTPNAVMPIFSAFMPKFRILEGFAKSRVDHSAL
jgi:hypothetical protein